LISGWLATFLFAVFLMPHNAWMVGSSGILFGALGWFTATEPFSRWSICFFGSAPLIVLAPVFVFLDGMTAIFFFKANAWQVHTAAFALGAAAGCLKGK
jgi:membrane associated rhomboid family serine protease